MVIISYKDLLNFLPFKSYFIPSCYIYLIIVLIVKYIFAFLFLLFI